MGGLLQQVAQCKSCHMPIFWLKHIVSGKRQPVDAGASPDGNIRIDVERGVYEVLGNPQMHPGPKHKSHFATCRDAANWKGGKPPTGPPRVDDPQALLEIPISMPYPGGEISKNGMFRGGNRRWGYVPEAEKWGQDLALALQYALLAEGVEKPALPVHVQVACRFFDKGHALDPQNLLELAMDSVEAGLGGQFNDRDFTSGTEPNLYDSTQVPEIVVKVRLGDVDRVGRFGGSKFNTLATAAAPAAARRRHRRRPGVKATHWRCCSTITSRRVPSEEASGRGAMS